MGPDPARDHARLGEFHQSVARWLEADEALLFEPCETVSQWSPAQHLLHALLVSDALLAQVGKLCEGDANCERGANPIVSVILATGRIPRGARQAPEGYLPPADLDRAELAEALAASRQIHAELAARLADVAGAQGRREHPFFGGLTAEQWLCAARVHSEHHLHIVDDIAKGRAPLAG